MAVEKTTIEYQIKAIDDSKAAFDKIQKGAKETESSFSSISKAVIIYNQALELSSKLMRAFGSAFNATATKAIALEKSVAEITTLFDESANYTKFFTQEILKLQSAYGTEQQDIAKAYYQAISSGAVNAATSTNLLVVAQKLAIGGVTDLSTSVDGLTTILNAYGLSAKEALNVSDALFIGMKAGKTTIGELSMSLGEAAALASASGVSFQELIGSVSAITTGGVQTAQAVTQVRSALVGLTKQTPQLTEVLSRLGMTNIKTAIESNGFVNVLKKVIAQTDGSTESLTELFGRIEAVNAILALTSNEIGGKFTNIMNDMGKAALNTGKITEEAFQKLARTTDFQMNVIKGRIDASFTRFGYLIKDSIIPAFESLSNAIESVVTSIEKLTRAIDAIDFSALKKKSDDLLISLSLVGAGITIAFRSQVILAIKAVTGVMITFGKAAIAAVAPIALMAFKFIAIASSIAAVVASVEILIRNIHQIPTLLETIGLAFKAWALRIQRFFEGALLGVMNAQVGIAESMNKLGIVSDETLSKMYNDVLKQSENIDSLNETINKTDEELKNVAKSLDFGFSGELINQGIKAIKAFNSEINETVKGADEASKKIKEISDNAPTGLDKYQVTPIFSAENLDLIGAAFGKAIMSAAASFSNILSFAVNAWLAAIDLFLSAVQKLIDVVPNLLDKTAQIFNSLTDLPGRIIDGLKKVNESLAYFLENFVLNFTQALVDSFDIVEGWGEMLTKSLEKLVQKLPQIISNVVLLFVRFYITHLPRMVLVLLSFLIRGIPRLATQLFQELKRLKIGTMIAEEFMLLINDLARLFNMKEPFKINIKDSLKELERLSRNVEKSTSDIFQVTDLAAAKRGLDVADKIRAAINSSMTRVRNIFRELWSMLEKLWRDVWGTLVKGVTKAWENIVSIWNTIWSVTMTTATKAWEAIVAVWRFVWEVLIGNATKAWNLLVEAWRAIWEITISGITTTWNNIVSIWRSVWEVSINATTKAWESISAVWRHIWSEIISPITSSLLRIADDLKSFRFPSFSWPAFPSFSWPDIPKPSWLVASGGMVISSASAAGQRISENWKRSDVGKAVTTVGKSISSAGKRLGLASGGIVPPTGKFIDGTLYAQSGAFAQGTDTVPAMLTPGEFVVNREAARYNLGLLSFMNKVKAPIAPVQSPTTISVIINAKTDLSPEQIKREVIPTLEKELRRKSLDGKFVLASQGLR